MKRPNGAGTVRKLGGKRRRPWAAVITTGWDPETGKRQQKYVGYYETYREAEDALILYRLDPMPAEDATLGSVYREWLATKGNVSKSARYGYEMTWRTLSRLENVKIKDIRTGQLQRLIDTATKEDGTNYSSGSLSRIKAVVVMIWDYAVKNDLARKNYAKFITLPRNKRREKDCFTALEVQKIRDAAATGVPWADAILIMIYSGFRITEFLSLDRFTVDLEQMTFRAGVKTDAGRNRLVPIHPCILPYVRSRLAQEGERMICKADGTKIDARRFRPDYYYPALERIGVRSLNPHCTRHTFATMLAEARVPAVEIQRLLGHAQYSTTANTYTHLDVNALRDAVGSL